MSEQPLNKNRNKLFLLLLLAALLVMVVLFIVSKRNAHKEISSRVKESIGYQRELDSLTFEFESIKKSYGSLNLQLRGKDSIIQENIERINQLIVSNKSKDRIIKEIEHLRGLKSDYERRLDSLLYINMELTDKNLELKYRVEAEKEKNIQLSEEKEEFKKKAVLGEKVRAYNLTANGFRTRGSDKESPTNKAKRVDRIKVCFTIGENLVIPPGEKSIYVRVSRPDNVVLSLGTGDQYSFNYQDEKIQYSMKQMVNYQNKSLPVCLNWDKIVEGSAMTGTYNVAVFFEGQEIGNTAFTLN